ncbi:MAG: TRAP transporter small permease [Pseudochelatococcus sp.]|uniref:TRAP transporter small permease n=1 Tax=Pseudochelatococcus sp. TaxID=2020869 RepID=UPI003D8DBBC8
MSTRPHRSGVADGLLAAAAICFLAGAAVTVIDVAIRPFRLNVPAAIEATSFAIGLGALVSIPVCYLLRSHVTAKLLSEMMPRRMARPLGLLGAASSALFAALLLWIMASNVWDKWGSPETTRDIGLRMDVLLAVVAATMGMSLAGAVAGLWREIRKER